MNSNLEVDRSSASNTVLNRLRENIFTLPYASDGKVNDIFQPAIKLPKQVALEKPIIQLNGPRRITYLCFDIDRRYGGIAWDDANLPPPNLVIINPNNLHAHLIYELAEPIWLNRVKDQTRQEAPPVRFLNTVKKAIQRALKADSSYNGLMCKNPFHASWTVRCGRETPYKLKELSAHLDLESEPPKYYRQAEPLNALTEGQRYVTLFDSVRKWAYRAIRYHRTFESFRNAVKAELEQLNQRCEPQPLRYVEIRDLCRKISRWTWEHLHHRIFKVDILPTDTIKERQRKAQHYTSTERVRKTTEAICQVVRNMVSRGVRLTKKGVAMKTGFDIKTVRRHWNNIVASPVAINAAKPQVSFDSSNNNEGKLADSVHPSSSISLPVDSSNETEGLRPLSIPPAGVAATPLPAGIPYSHSQFPPPVTSRAEHAAKLALIMARLREIDSIMEKHNT